MTTKEELLASARQALRNNDLQKAITLYDQCHRLDMPIQNEYAGALYAAGNPNGAEVILDAALASSGQNKELVFLRGIARTATGNHSGALQDFTSVIDEFPSHVPALLNRAALLSQADHLDEALLDFMLVCTLQPDSLIAWANAGIIHLKKGSYAEAEIFLSKACQLAPERIQLTRSLANALRGAGKIKQSLELHRQVEHSLPNDPASLTDHAFSLLADHQFQQAQERFLRAFHLDPLDQTALAGWYLTANQLGQQHSVNSLMDYSKLVSNDTISITDTELASLLAATQAHPQLRWEPAGKSTTGGQQSVMLDLSAGSPFHAFGQNITQIVRHRMDALKTDASLSSHPWTAGIPSQWRLQAWATILHGEGGRQSPHLHPAGWLSGVFYLDSGNSAPDQGSLIFGHAPDDLNLPARPHEERLTAVTGHVYCFPSYFLHHTTPYYGSRARISLAFDVVPEAASALLTKQAITDLVN